MTREEKKKAIDALKISVPVMVVTQEEFNDYIQTLNQVMDWLEQEPKTDKVIKMREATSEEQKSVDEYIKSISKPTGVDFWDLDQEPCDDAISRQAVDDAIYDYSRSCDVNYAQIMEYIDKLPSVKPQEPKWIPVGERLPEHYQNILFSTKTNRVFEGRYFKDETEHQWYSFRDECFAWNNVVTAWMPLPEPYEPQERSE